MGYNYCTQVPINPDSFNHCFGNHPVYIADQSRNKYNGYPTYLKFTLCVFNDKPSIEVVKN